MSDEADAILNVDAITPTFIASIDPALLDVLTELSEAGLDSFLNAGAFNEVPLIKTLVGVAKTAMGVREANLVRQTAIFLKELLSGKLDDKALQKHRQKLSNDSKAAARELGFVLTLIDRNADTVRSAMLGRLYMAFINESIRWDEFVDMSEVVSRCMVSDLVLLESVNRGEVTESDSTNAYRADRLAGLGLVSQSMKTEVVKGDLEFKNDSYLVVTPFGSTFCRYALV